MLEVLRGHAGEGVSDVVAVVTRWFGGTLLGAGGLVRPTATPCAPPSAPAGRCAARSSTSTCSTSTTPTPDGSSELRSRGVAVLDSDYGPHVTLRLGVPRTRRERLAALVARLTAGDAETRWRASAGSITLNSPHEAARCARASAGTST